MVIPRENFDFIELFAGVLGKGFIEKLLRSTDVKKIYLLLRMKKGQSVFERMEDFRNGKVGIFRLVG